MSRSVAHSDEATGHEMTRLQERSSERRKWIRDLKIGHELWRDAGRWTQKYRFADRASDEYVEHIFDLETGEVIRSVREPLSKHQGHGSAKARRPREHERP